MDAAPGTLAARPGMDKVPMDDDGFPNIDAYWKHHLPVPLQEATNTPPIRRQRNQQAQQPGYVYQQAQPSPQPQPQQQQQQQLALRQQPAATLESQPAQAQRHAQQVQPTPLPQEAVQARAAAQAQTQAQARVAEQPAAAGEGDDSTPNTEPPSPAAQQELQHQPMRPPAEGDDPEAAQVAHQHQIREDTREHVDQFWSNAEEETAAFVAAAKARVETAALQRDAEARAVAVQREAERRAMAKVIAQQEAVKKAREDAIASAVSSSAPVPLGTATLTNNVGRSPMVPKSRAAAASSKQPAAARSAQPQQLSYSYTRGSASAAASSAPIEKQDAEQVAAVPGRSPLKSKSRGFVRVAVAAPSAPPAASAAACGLHVPRGFEQPVAALQSAPAAVQRPQQSQPTPPVVVPQPDTPTIPNVRAADRRDDKVAVSAQQQIPEQRSRASGSTAARGRTPMARSKPSRSARHSSASSSSGRQRQQQPSRKRQSATKEHCSDSEGEGSADEGDELLRAHSGQGSERESKSQLRRSSVPDRAHKPSTMKSIQSRIGQSASAVESARRGGPPSQQQQSFAQNSSRRHRGRSSAPGSPTDSTQSENDDSDEEDDRRQPSFHRAANRPHRIASEDEDVDDEHSGDEGQVGVFASETISPVQYRGSSDDDGNESESPIVGDDTMTDMGDMGQNQDFSIYCQREDSAGESEHEVELEKLHRSSDASHWSPLGIDRDSDSDSGGGSGGESSGSGQVQFVSRHARQSRIATGSESSENEEEESDDEDTAPIVQTASHSQQQRWHQTPYVDKRKVSFNMKANKQKTYITDDDSSGSDSDSDGPSTARSPRRLSQPKPACRQPNAVIIEAATTGPAESPQDVLDHEQFRRETEQSTASVSPDPGDDFGMDDYSHDIEADQEEEHEHERDDRYPDEQDSGPRKSRRKRFRPLAYHLGERVHYWRGSTDDMPSIVTATVNEGSSPADADTALQARAAAKLKPKKLAPATTAKEQMKEQKHKKKKPTKRTTAKASAAQPQQQKDEEDDEQPPHDFDAEDGQAPMLSEMDESSISLVVGGTPRLSKQPDRLRRLTETGDHALGMDDSADGGSKSAQQQSVVVADEEDDALFGFSFEQRRASSGDESAVVEDSDDDDAEQAPSNAHAALRKGGKAMQMSMHNAAGGGASKASSKQKPSQISRSKRPSSSSTATKPVAATRGLGENRQRVSPRNASGGAKPKNGPYWQATDANHGGTVRRNDEFCLKNEELCIENEEFRIKMMNFADRSWRSQ